MLKQFLVIAAVASFLATALIGCSDSPPQSEDDWSYGPPADFKQQDKKKNNATVFIADTDQGFAANLQVASGTNPYDSAQKLGELAIEKAVQQNNATIKEKESYSIPGSDAYTWMITQVHNGVQVSQRQFIVKKNKIVVLFTLTATAKAMERYDQELADSLKTFKWGKQ